MLTKITDDFYIDFDQIVFINRDRSDGNQMIQIFLECEPNDPILLRKEHEKLFFEKVDQYIYKESEYILFNSAPEPSNESGCPSREVFQMSKILQPGANEF